MPSRSRRLSTALTGVAVDIGALRESKPFRRLTAGQLVSLIGRQITTVAVPYQVYTTTGSPTTHSPARPCKVPVHRADWKGRP